MNQAAELELTLVDHTQALTEVSFLLDVFATTVDELMGGATASVGRIAGRHMARKLPVYLSEPALAPALEAVAGNLASGFEIAYECRENGADLHFGSCLVRTVCGQRGREIGGPLCRLFHAYLDGIVNDLICRPVKSQIAPGAESCHASLAVR